MGCGPSGEQQIVVNVSQNVMNTNNNSNMNTAYNQPGMMHPQKQHSAPSQSYPIDNRTNYGSQQQQPPPLIDSRTSQGGPQQQPLSKSLPPPV